MYFDPSVSAREYFMEKYKKEKEEEANPDSAAPIVQISPLVSSFLLSWDDPNFKPYPYDDSGSEKDDPWNKPDPNPPRLQVWKKRRFLNPRERLPRKLRVLHTTRQKKHAKKITPLNDPPLQDQTPPTKDDSSAANQAGSSSEDKEEAVVAQGDGSEPDHEPDPDPEPQLQQPQPQPLLQPDALLLKRRQYVQRKETIVPAEMREANSEEPTVEQWLRSQLKDEPLLRPKKRFNKTKRDGAKKEKHSLLAADSTVPKHRRDKTFQRDQSSSSPEIVRPLSIQKRKYRKKSQQNDESIPFEDFPMENEDETAVDGMAKMQLDEAEIEGEDPLFEGVIDHKIKFEEEDKPEPARVERLTCPSESSKRDQTVKAEKTHPTHPPAMVNARKDIKTEDSQQQKTVSKLIDDPLTTGDTAMLDIHEKTARPIISPKREKTVKFEETPHAVPPPTELNGRDYVCKEEDSHQQQQSAAPLFSVPPTADEEMTEWDPFAYEAHLTPVERVVPSHIQQKNVFIKEKDSNQQKTVSPKVSEPLTTADRIVMMHNYKQTPSQRKPFSTPVERVVPSNSQPKKDEETTRPNIPSDKTVKEELCTPKEPHASLQKSSLSEKSSKIDQKMETPLRPNMPAVMVPTAKKNSSDGVIEEESSQRQKHVGPSAGAPPTADEWTEEMSDEKTTRTNITFVKAVKEEESSPKKPYPSQLESTLQEKPSNIDQKLKTHLPHKTPASMVPTTKKSAKEGLIKDEHSQQQKSAPPMRTDSRETPSSLCSGITFRSSNSLSNTPFGQGTRLEANHQAKVYEVGDDDSWNNMDMGGMSDCEEEIVTEPPRREETATPRPVVISKVATSGKARPKPEKAKMIDSYEKTLHKPTKKYDAKGHRIYEEIEPDFSGLDERSRKSLQKYFDAGFRLVRMEDSPESSTDEDEFGEIPLTNRIGMATSKYDVPIMFDPRASLSDFYKYGTIMADPKLSKDRYDCKQEKKRRMLAKKRRANALILGDSPIKRVPRDRPAPLAKSAPIASVPTKKMATPAPKVTMTKKTAAPPAPNGTPATQATLPKDKGTPAPIAALPKGNMATSAPLDKLSKKKTANPAPLANLASHASPASLAPVSPLSNLGSLSNPTPLENLAPLTTSAPQVASPKDNMANPNTNGTPLLTLTMIQNPMITLMESINAANASKNDAPVRTLATVFDQETAKIRKMHKKKNLNAAPAAASEPTAIPAEKAPQTSGGAASEDEDETDEPMEVDEVEDATEETKALKDKLWPRVRGNLRCVVCFKSFDLAHRQRIRYHVLFHCPFKSFQCKYCKFDSVELGKVKRHAVQRHGADFKKDPEQHTPIFHQNELMKASFDATMKQCFPDFDFGKLSIGRRITKACADQTPYECSACQEICKEDAINFHIADRHYKSKLYNCAHCQFRAANLFLMSAHYQLSHQKELREELQPTSVNFRHESAYTIAGFFPSFIAHKRMEENQLLRDIHKTFDPDFDALSVDGMTEFLAEQELLKGTEQQQLDTLEQCEVCGGIFNEATMFQLITHARSHANKKLYQWKCPEGECGFVALHKYQVDIHISRFHPNCIDLPKNRHNELTPTWNKIFKRCFSEVPFTFALKSATDFNPSTQGLPGQIEANSAPVINLD